MLRSKDRRRTIARENRPGHCKAARVNSRILRVGSIPQSRDWPRSVPPGVFPHRQGPALRISRAASISPPGKQVRRLRHAACGQRAIASKWHVMQQALQQLGAHGRTSRCLTYVCMKGSVRWIATVEVPQHLRIARMRGRCSNAAVTTRSGRETELKRRDSHGGSHGSVRVLGGERAKHIPS